MFKYDSVPPGGGNLIKKLFLSGRRSIAVLFVEWICQREPDGTGSGILICTADRVQTAMLSYLIYIGNQSLFILSCLQTQRAEIRARSNPTFEWNDEMSVQDDVIVQTEQRLIEYIMRFCRDFQRK